MIVLTSCSKSLNTMFITATPESQYMSGISQIRYYAASGPVSPEYQWKEEIIITTDEVTITRSGNDPDTVINEGEWIIAVDQAEIEKLFTTLEAVDISLMTRVDYEEPITGDGYESIRITYENDQTFSISDDSDGKTQNADLINKPIGAFLQQLDFPE